MGWCWVDGRECYLHNQSGLLNSRIEFCKGCDVLAMHRHSAAYINRLAEAGSFPQEHVIKAGEATVLYSALLLQLIRNEIDAIKFEIEYFLEEEKEDKEVDLRDLHELQEIISLAVAKDMEL